MMRTAVSITTTARRGTQIHILANGDIRSHQVTSEGKTLPLIIALISICSPLCFGEQWATDFAVDDFGDKSSQRVIHTRVTGVFCVSVPHYVPRFQNTPTQTHITNKQGKAPKPEAFTIFGSNVEKPA